MLLQRVATALVALPILLSVLFLAPPLVARGVIAALIVAAAWEWSRFLSASALAPRIAFVAAVAVTAWLILILPTGEIERVAFSLAALAWLAAAAWCFFYPTAIPRSLAWIAGLLVLLPTLVALNLLYGRSPWLLLGLLCIVWLADIGAYFAGRAFGRTKLAPAISPGKTWEGVVGGLVFAVGVATAVAVLYLDQSPATVVPLLLLVVLISVVGDLTVSMFKRTAGIKDSGRVFPGHGGILDRIDSVCAAAPCFAGGSRLLGLL